MKRIQKLFVLSFIFFTCMMNLTADCNEEDIKYVKDDTHIYWTQGVPVKELFVDIVVYPVNIDIYLEIEGDGETNQYFFDGTTNIFTVSKYNIYKEIKYTVKVYSNNESCKDELIFTKIITTPKINKYYDNALCEYNRDFKWCGIFSDTQNVSEEELEKAIKNHEIEENKTNFKKMKEFLQKYYIYIVFPSGIISSIYVIKIIKLKRRNK